MAFDVDGAFRDHGGVLFGYAVNALGDRADAEELVQEVFVRAWRSGAGYDPGRASVRTWLFAIARNLALDVHRARGRRPRTVAAVPAGPGDGLDGRAVARGGHEPGPEEEVVRRMQVTEALARLSPDHREVVVAVHLEGRTYAELAERTGTAVATLRTRMHYGLRAMRSVLDEAGRSGHE